MSVDPTVAKAEAKELQIKNETAEIARDKASFEVQQQRVQALAPDFSKVDRGSLELKGEQPLFGTILARQALVEAAKGVASAVKKAFPDESELSILVTGDAELATSDAVYWNVVTALDQLKGVTENLLSSTLPPAAATGAPIPAADQAKIAPLSVLAPAVSAGASLAAQVLPGIISLLAAHRTVSVAPVSASDLGSALAVAGSLKKALKSCKIVHDDFRLLTKGALDEAVTNLITNRGRLAEAKVRLEAEHPEGKAAIRAIEEALTAVNAFVSYLTAVPAGAMRSPLATAVLREQLHPESDGTMKFSHVLLVKADAGSTTEETEERWMRRDRYTVVSAISVNYSLISTANSEVLTAGSSAGRITGHGEIGKTLKFDD